LIIWLASTKHEGEVGIDGALMKRELEDQNTVNPMDVLSMDAFMIKIREWWIVLNPKDDHSGSRIYRTMSGC